MQGCQAGCDADPKRHAYADSDTHAHRNSDTHCDTHSDSDTHANSDRNAYANADPDRNTESDAGRQSRAGATTRYASREADSDAYTFSSLKRAPKPCSDWREEPRIRLRGSSFIPTHFVPCCSTLSM
jgi:hypothetical protein